MNMLRNTMEVFSGVVGGVDGLTVGCFDEALRPGSEFSRRVARNAQVLLQKEFNLLQPEDPAGGSWYVEKLTDELARKAKLCEDLRSVSNLFDIRLQTDNKEYCLCENGYLFTLKLPGVIEDKVEVYLHNLDMTIRIGNFNRCIPLPNTLQRSQITSVQLDQGVLKIQFKIPKLSQRTGKCGLSKSGLLA